MVGAIRRSPKYPGRSKWMPKEIFNLVLVVHQEAKMMHVVKIEQVTR